MARGVNKVILVGTCGQDPEVKYLSNGNAVTNLSLATSEQWKDKQSGEKKEKTEWVRLVFFKKLAEIVSEYVKKGSLLFVSGKLQTRRYEKDGATHYVTEIIADKMQRLDPKPASDGDVNPYGNYNNSSEEVPF